MTRKMVQFQVSAELIKQSLAMPDDAQIYNITRHEYNPDVFVFFVEHPDFEEIEEASAPPEVAPIIEADYAKRPSMWLTFSWGHPPLALVAADRKECGGDRDADHGG